MIPSINFVGLSKEPVVIFGGRMYHASSSEIMERDYLALSGLQFPLRQGQTLADYEARYVKTNSQALDAIVTAEAENLGKIRVDFLNKALSFKEDLLYFFKEICVPYERNTADNSELSHFFSEDVVVPQVPKTDFAWHDVLPAVLSINCALINRRMYPLIENQRVSETNLPFVNIAQRDYEIRPAVWKAEDIDAKFVELMVDQLKNKGRYEFTNNISKSAKVSDLEKKLGNIELLAGVKKLAHAYEFGDIGYDFTRKVVYWLIPAHYNNTAGTSYGEGLSAVTLHFDKQVLSAAKPSFAYRNSVNSPFEFHGHSNCYGNASICHGTTIDDIMAMLRACRMVVINEGRFYQDETSSSNDN